MQFRLASAIVLFLGSYFPLALILLVQDIPRKLWGRSVCGFTYPSHCTYQIFEHTWMAFGGVAITGISMFLTLQALGKIRFRFPVVVEEVKSVPNDIINYVFPYVVSFMGLSYDDPGKVAGFLVFLAVLFVITYKSGQIVMNPLLIIFGWRLYEVKMTIGSVQAVKITRVFKKGKLLPGSQRAEEVQDFYFMGEP